MPTGPWDPLERSLLSSEIVGATLKREIKNILKSYTGWFDPLSELIQNALDAVETRKKQDIGYKPKIWVTINLQDNYVSVTDNGIGFPEDEFRSFLAPNVSFKGQEDRGNKGVGATYLAYGFNHLQIGTKTPDFAFIGALKKGREWVEDTQGVQMRPKVVEESEPIDSNYSNIDRGATFTLKLTGKYIRPKNLNWIGASTASQWASILRIKSPLGGVYINKECPTIVCCLKVVDENGKQTYEEIGTCEYIFPHKVISTCVNIREIQAAQSALLKSGKDPSKLPDKYSKLNGYFNSWNADEILSDAGPFKGRFDNDQKELIHTYKVACYGFLCYSTDIWDKYNDETLGIRKGERILRGGLQLATNSMPQGELIVIPLTRNIGYQNVAHVIVHFEGADPDLGRKGFQPELVELAKDISVSIVNLLLNYKQFLKKETGAPPDIVAKKNIHDWIRSLENHEERTPLTINRKDLFLPLCEPSITSKPLEEQDVISLFNQLLAGGVIRGIKLLATSSYKQYDCVFRFSLKAPLENFIFDRGKNPLGVTSENAKEYLSEPRILEYKYSFDALIEEIEKEEKNEKEIELVVAWEMGNKWKTRYEITPLLHFSNAHHRFFHGATHLAKNLLTGDKVFPLIILSELIDYINDPEAVQKYQADTYITS